MIDTVKIAVPIKLAKQEIKDIEWTQTDSFKRFVASRSIYMKLYDEKIQRLPIYKVFIQGG
ncbi:hypothetical protein GCM10027286_13600 [Virgibacillus ainsalahensis]